MIRGTYLGQLVLASLAALLLTLTPTARSEDKKPVKEDTAKADKEPTHKDTAEDLAGEDAITNVSMAYDLADYGRRNSMPEAMVTAALVLARYTIKDASEEKVTEAVSYAPADLLKEAAGLAKSDVQKALVKQARIDLKEVKRGLFSSLKKFVKNLVAGAKKVVEHVVKVGRKVVITVKKIASTIKRLTAFPVFRLIIKSPLGKILKTIVSTNPILSFIATTAKVIIEVTKISGQGTSTVETIVSQ